MAMAFKQDELNIQKRLAYGKLVELSRRGMISDHEFNVKCDDISNLYTAITQANDELTKAVNAFTAHVSKINR